VLSDGIPLGIDWKGRGRAGEGEGCTCRKQKDKDKTAKKPIKTQGSTDDTENRVLGAAFKINLLLLLPFSHLRKMLQKFLLLKRSNKQPKGQQNA